MLNNWLGLHLPPERFRSNSGSSLLSSSSFRSRSSSKIDTRKTIDTIREDYVQKAIKFLSHPSVISSPELHLHFLESKGLNSSEIQESLNRLQNIQNDELLDASYDPLFVLPQVKYEEFLDRISQPSAIRVANSLHSFINIFTQGLGSSYSTEDKGKMVQNQITLISDEVSALYQKLKIRISPLIITECVEKYLMTKLFEFTFVPTPKDARKNQLLNQKIMGLQSFIQTKHLDIPDAYKEENLWSIAQEELRNVNMYQTPHDKLMCIVKACKSLFSAIQLLSQEQPVNADMFLPVLIYNIIRANPDCLHSNVEFVQNFRHGKMFTESGYFFVSFCTAVAFIEQISPSSLTIDPEEYEKNMRLVVADYESLAELIPAPSVNRRSTTTSPAISPVVTPRPGKKDNVELLLACIRGNLIDVKRLVLAGCSVDYAFTPENSEPTGGSDSDLQLQEGDFPLGISSKLGDYQIVKFLLENGADVNHRNADGQTALHMECIGHQIDYVPFYNLDIIELLVKGGASLDLRDKYGKTPLDYATKANIDLLQFSDKRSASIKEEEEHVSRMLSSVTIPQKNSPES